MLPLAIPAMHTPFLLVVVLPFSVRFLFPVQFRGFDGATLRCREAAITQIVRVTDIDAKEEKKMKHFASRSSRSGSPKPRFQYSTSKRSKVLRCPRVARKYAELNQNASGFTDSRSANACAAFQRNGIRLLVYTRVVSPSWRVNRVVKMLNDTINRTYTHER